MRRLNRRNSFSLLVPSMCVAGCFYSIRSMALCGRFVRAAQSVSRKACRSFFFCGSYCLEESFPAGQEGSTCSFYFYATEIPRVFCWDNPLAASFNRLGGFEKAQQMRCSAV